MSNQNLHEFYIFNSEDELIFFLDFDCGDSTKIERTEIVLQDVERMHKIENVIGIALATKSIVEKLSPFPIISFKNFTTNKYKYSIYEIMTGIRFILITEVDDIDYCEILFKVFNDAYLEYIKRNVLYKNNSIIKNLPLFTEKVKEILSAKK